MKLTRLKKLFLGIDFVASVFATSIAVAIVLGVHYAFIVNGMNTSNRKLFGVLAFIIALFCNDLFKIWKRQQEDEKSIENLDKGQEKVVETRGT